MIGNGRRPDIDWLRVFATYALFVFHVGKTFDVAPFYHIKNDELSPHLDVLTGFIGLWHMPLFFVLAGWSSFASLSRRGPAGFRRARLRRLLVPLLAGSIVLCPILKYLELSSGMSMSAAGFTTSSVPFEQSFLEFLPTFYSGLDRFTWSHLWFLAYLLTFSLLYTGLFVRLIERPGRFAEASAARLYLPLVPLVTIQMTLRLVWPGVQNLFNDWANFSYYSIFFILGFVLARCPAWSDVIGREWRRAGGIGLATCAVMQAIVMLRGGEIWPSEPTLTSVLGLLPLLGLSAVAGYCLIVAMLGFARTVLRATSRRLEYLAEASLPIYILHQAGIVIPGYFLLQIDAGIATKFLLVFAVAVVTSQAVYHLLVRPFGPMRFLFGMTPETSGARTIAHRAAGSEAT